MRALVANALGDLSVDDVPEPELPSGGVLVQTKVTAVSAGTERRMLFGRPGDVREHAPDFPVIGAFGYLAAGDIIAVGKGVEGLNVGQRVSAGRAWGAHREILDTDAHSVVPVPDTMSYMEAAASYWAVPPFAGILAAAPRPYGDAAVVGLGPLGLSAVQILTRLSRRVLAIDVVESRVDLARSYGAIAVNTSTTAVDDALAEMAPGPEVVIEASGTQAGLEMALSVVRPLGRVALVGVPPPLKDMDLFWPMQHKGVKLVPLHRESTSSPQGGGKGSPRDTYLPDVLDMIERELLDIDSMTSWIVPPEEAPTAFDLLHRHSDQVVGVGFAWDAEESRHVDHYETMRSATRGH
jgi:threonine dehydrogenase-like Zn-dependent dehydrogenase